MSSSKDTPDTLRKMLEFAYSDSFDGEPDSDLFNLAKTFNIQGLVKLCGRGIAKTLTTANALDLLDEAYSEPGEALKYLKDAALDFSADNIEELMRSDQWSQRVSSYSRRSNELFSIFNAKLKRKAKIIKYLYESDEEMQPILIF